MTWDDFFVAELGASAALAGLLFVGLSINLKRILEIPHLPDRALSALALLVLVLFVASLFLVPGQSGTALGLELLAIGGAGWIVLSALWVRWIRAAPRPIKGRALLSTVCGEIAMISYVVGALGLLIGWSGATGLVVPAFLASIGGAIIDAWVLLIEINR